MGELSVSVSGDGRLIVSGSRELTVWRWDGESGESVEPPRGHGGWVRSVTVSGDEKLIVSGSWDTTVRRWDRESGESF